MDRKELDVVYDELFSKAQAVLDRYDPCQFDAAGSCFAGRYFNNPARTCCWIRSAGTNCEHLDAGGCTTRNLACKLFLCFQVVCYSDEGKQAEQEMSVLREEARGRLSMYGHEAYFKSESKLKNKLVKIQSALNRS